MTESTEDPLIHAVIALKTVRQYLTTVRDSLQGSPTVPRDCSIDCVYAQHMLNPTEPGLMNVSNVREMLAVEAALNALTPEQRSGAVTLLNLLLTPPPVRDSTGVRSIVNFT